MWVKIKKGKLFNPYYINVKIDMKRLYKLTDCVHKRNLNMSAPEQINILVDKLKELLYYTYSECEYDSNVKLYKKSKKRGIK